MQVDRGAVKFILSSADIMIPGLLAQGGKVTPGLKKDSAVAVMVDTKEHAIAVGQLTMSSQELIAAGKGMGIINQHHLDDGLWKMDKFDL